MPTSSAPPPPSSIPPAIQTVQDAAPPLSLTWAHLRNRHPDHDAAYWRQLRALLEGGKRLLRDADLMNALFPPHADEDLDVYEARKARAFFLPYPGEIIGDLVGLLDQDPVDVRAQRDETLDPFYTGTFLTDCDRKGTAVTGFVQVVAREALTVGRAWVLCDLPVPDPDKPAASLLEQEQREDLRAFVSLVEAERVLDWEDDDDGCLLWCVVHQCTKRRADPAQRRDAVTEVFVVYTATHWHRFVVTYPEGKAPRDDEVFAPVQAGAHTFGRVPVLRFDMPEGLWAMDKLFGAARAVLNQRSALSYAQLKHLFPILTAHLGPEMGGGGSVPSEAQQNPARATEQTYGVGRVHVFGKDDVLKYTSPDSSVFSFAAQDLKDLRDEMHRVTYTMAASMEGSSAAAGRSGESKREDRTAKERVLAHLGVRLCAFLKRLLRTVATGRGDADSADAFVVTGLASFDEVSSSEAIADAQIIDGLKIPSATFQRVHRKALARKILARDATPDEMEKIGKEIDSNTSDEEFAGLPPRTGPVVPPPGAQPPAGGQRPAIPPPPGGQQPPAIPPPPRAPARA